MNFFLIEIQNENENLKKINNDLIINNNKLKLKIYHWKTYALKSK